MSNSTCNHVPVNTAVRTSKLEWLKLASKTDQCWGFGNIVTSRLVTRKAGTQINGISSCLSEWHKRNVTRVLRTLTCAHILLQSYIMQCKDCLSSLTSCIFEASKMEFNNM